MNILHLAAAVQPWSLSTFALDAVSSGVEGDHFLLCSRLSADLAGVKWVRESRYPLWSTHRAHEVARIAKMVAADVIHVHHSPLLLARLAASRVMSSPFVVSVGPVRSLAEPNPVAAVSRAVLRRAGVVAAVAGPGDTVAGSAFGKVPVFCFQGVVEPPATIPVHVGCRVVSFATASSKAFQEAVAAELVSRRMADPVVVLLDGADREDRHAAGSLSDLADMVASADVVIVPAVRRHEMGRLIAGVMLAQAAGCCLLVADRSPMSSMLRRSSVSWSSAGSPADVAAAAAMLLGDHQRRSELQVAAHGAAVAAWRYGSVVDRTRAAYVVASGLPQAPDGTQDRRRGVSC